MRKIQVVTKEINEFHEFIKQTHIQRYSHFFEPYQGSGSLVLVLPSFFKQPHYLKPWQHIKDTSDRIIYLPLKRLNHNVFHQYFLWYLKPLMLWGHLENMKKVS